MMTKSSRLGTERTRVWRQPCRGAYNRDDVYSVLDHALFGHVAHVDVEQPFCIPMLQARVDDISLIQVRYHAGGKSLEGRLRLMEAGAVDILGLPMQPAATEFPNPVSLPAIRNQRGLGATTISKAEKRRFR